MREPAYARGAGAYRGPSCSTFVEMLHGANESADVCASAIPPR